MSILSYFLVFILGGAIGSFVNVMIARSIKGEDFVKGRSRCDYCHKVLAWYDMIPLFSYLVYGGQSRCCHKKLSWQHPLVELLFGALLVWWVLMGSLFFHLAIHPFAVLQPGFWLGIGVLFLIVVVSDLYYGMIPVLAVQIGSIMTVIYRLSLYVYGYYNQRDLLWSILMAVLMYMFFAGLRRITKGKGMGEGDVVLAPWLGLLLGYPRTIVALWIAFVVGATVGVVMILLGKTKMKGTLPFGPFLILGTVIALLWGNIIWASYF